MESNPTKPCHLAEKCLKIIKIITTQLLQVCFVKNKKGFNNDKNNEQRQTKEIKSNTAQRELVHWLGQSKKALESSVHSFRY